MNLINRFFGVFLSPQATFKVIAEKPAWAGTFIILLIAIAIFSFFSAPYQASDQLELFKNNARMQERLGEERFNKMISDIENAPPWRKYIGTGFAPIFLGIGFLLSSAIIFGMGRMFSSEGKFITVFAALLHANYIDKILGSGLRALLIYTKQSVMQVSTGLAIFFPNLEVTSSLYIILANVDFFHLWLFGALGLGLSYIFKVEVKKGMLISYGFWLFKSIINILFTLLSLKLSGLA